MKLLSLCIVICFLIANAAPTIKLLRNEYDDVVISPPAGLYAAEGILSVFEDYEKFIQVSYIDFFGDTAEIYASKANIQFVIVDGDTIPMIGKRLANVDTSSSLSDVDFKPQGGCYRSITELMYNSPRFIDPNLEMIRTTLELRYDANPIEVMSVTKPHDDKFLAGVVWNGECYWGHPQAMTKLHLHPKYSWYKKIYAVYDVPTIGGMGVAVWLITRSSNAKNKLPYNGGEVGNGFLHFDCEIIVMDMVARKEFPLNKSSLKRLLKEQNPALYKKFWKAGSKEGLVEPYFKMFLDGLNSTAQ